MEGAMLNVAPHQNEIFELLKYVKIRKHAFDHQLIRQSLEVATALKTLELNLRIMRSKLRMARARTVVIHQASLVAIAPSQYGGQKEIYFKIIQIIDNAKKLVNTSALPS